jgi:hypothetical protein
MTVWDIYGNEGKVTKIEVVNTEGGYYPVSIRFANYEKTYTNDGRLVVHNPISIFQTKPIITPNVPLIQFEKGELVLCRESTNGVWSMRYFSHKDDISGFWCFDMQQKTGSCSKWDEIRKINDNPLLET